MCSGIDQSPTFSLVFSPPPFFFFLLCLLSYVSDSGAARIFEQGAKRGSRATERGRDGVGPGWGWSPPPSHGRENFENSCIKTAFFFSHKMSLLWVGYV